MDDKKINKIEIEVDLDVNKIPEKIIWRSNELPEKETKAFLLSVWDGEKNNTLRLDLWTKDMTVEEMKKFFFQIYITMSETFERATGEDQMSLAMREFAEFFGEKLSVIKPTGKFDK